MSEPGELAPRAVRLAVAGVGAERIRGAVTALLDAGAACTPAAVIAALEQRLGAALPAAPAVAAAERALRRLHARVLVVGAPGYPRRLADAWPELAAPVWVFAQTPPAGLPDGPAVAVVGTRRPSVDGLRSAASLGRLLVEAGVTVVSGLARGIDQAAHRAALEAGGATVAVLGAGLGVDYPHGTAALRRAVSAAGGIVSEYAPGTPARAHRFLERNRILSALADATVVVEGRARSGALHTARLAAEQGREVLAVPGSPNTAQSAAPLALIRDGARPLTRLDEVLEALGLDGAAAGEQPALAARGHGLSAEAVAVQALLGAVPVGLDDLAEAAGLGAPAVLAAVTELTAAGLATATPRGIVAGS